MAEGGDGARNKQPGGGMTANLAQEKPTKAKKLGTRNAPRGKQDGMRDLKKFEELRKKGGRGRGHEVLKGGPKSGRHGPEKGLKRENGRRRGGEAAMSTKKREKTRGNGWLLGRKDTR